MDKSIEDRNRADRIIQVGRILYEEEELFDTDNFNSISLKNKDENNGKVEKQ